MGDLNNISDNIQKETLNEEEIKDINSALENVKKGKVKPIEQVAKEMGITIVK